LSGGASEERPVALVTGGGTGIGAACCRALAAEGFRVGVHYRSSEESARKLCAGLDGAFTLRADLALAEEIDALIVELKDKAGRVDVLVNNAGFNVNAPMLAMGIEDYDRVAAMSRGTWYLTKCVLRRFMLRKKTGRIVNISSVVGPRRLHQEPQSGARRPRHPGELGGARLHRHRDDRGAARGDQGGDPDAHPAAAHGAGRGGGGGGRLPRHARELREWDGDPRERRDVRRLRLERR
jgi:NAD(P)-dependent dehydrogenase (short-subunit alcohol dehydrogenase family)